MSRPQPLLLAIVEIGGYPNFTSLYESLGFRVIQVSSVRKAIAVLKKEHPAVIVAEFNFQTDFRDRTSNLESLMATLQRTGTENAPIGLIIFYEKEHEVPLQRLYRSYPDITASLTFPVDLELLQSSLAPFAGPGP